MSSDYEEHTNKGLGATPDAPRANAFLSRVLAAIMRSALTGIGATSGQLMRVENGELSLLAQTARPPEVARQMAPPIETPPLIWLVAQAVASSGQPLALDTSSEITGMFAVCDDPMEIPCSVCCLPLHHGGQLVAVLYLENEQTEHAFPTGHHSLLELLASQIVCALYDAEDPSVSNPEADAPYPVDHGLRNAHCALSQASREAAVDALVASITHEMSQPLSAIDASSSAGLRWLQRDVPNFEEAIISLEKVRSCAMRARKIIDDLRSLTNRSPVPVGRFDIHSAIREVVLLSRPRINAVGAKIAFAGMTDTQQVIGDRAQIQQVIENLIVNALEAMADATDRERIIHLASAETSDESVTISITDTGPGIAPGCEEKLFRPFVTTRPRSIGMGLPICKRIIEAHGGTIWVEKTSPAGSCFSFTLDRSPSGEGMH